MTHDVSIPNIGENVDSGTVVSILVSVGDRVAKDDGIIEFETDKALVEIPAPVGGRVVEILVDKGDTLSIGDIVARLESEDSEAGEAAEKPQDETPDEKQPSAPEETEKKSETEERQASDSREASAEKAADAPTPEKSENEEGLPVPAAPSIRRLARELGVDIRQVQGSGPGGRISEKDVKAFVKTRLSASTEAEGAPSAAGPETDLPDFSQWGSVEVSGMTTVRRITAESMSAAWRTIPHVTQFDRADITHIQEWIDRVRGNDGERQGKPTVTAVLFKVVAVGLKTCPRFNASLDVRQKQIIFKQYIHIGMAVDTERGLLVPVIRDVDRKSVAEIADEIRDLAERARSKRIKPDEMEGGTFTISNQGSIGGDNFTPIVYWPQAGILGVSRAATEPRFAEGEWVPRKQLPLSLSYDHRLNDGADAARFLRWICGALEYPMSMQ